MVFADIEVMVDALVSSPYASWAHERAEAISQLIDQNFGESRVMLELRLVLLDELLKCATFSFAKTAELHYEAAELAKQFPAPGINWVGHAERALDFASKCRGLEPLAYNAEQLLLEFNEHRRIRL